ncbi:unnamed protein product [Rhizophagus irregularis]|nr:unnamed protein product [Rhizophagus irregularis]
MLENILSEWIRYDRNENYKEFIEADRALEQERTNTSITQPHSQAEQTNTSITQPYSEATSIILSIDEIEVSENVDCIIKD